MKLFCNYKKISQYLKNNNRCISSYNQMEKIIAEISAKYYLF